MVDLNNINHEATYRSCVAITEEESHELFPPEPRPCKIFDSLIVDQCFIIPLNAQGEPLTTNFEYLSGGPVMIKVNAKEVFEIKNPSDAFLPKQHPSSRFVFAREDRFFAYPNNFNHYVNYYRNTFQHGGVSLEEVIIPYIVLSPKQIS